MKVQQGNISLLTSKMWSYSSSSVVTMDWALLAAAVAARSWEALSGLTSDSSSSPHSPANKGRNKSGAIHAATADAVIRLLSVCADTARIILKILKGKFLRKKQLIRDKEVNTSNTRPIY